MYSPTQPYEPDDSSGFGPQSIPPALPALDNDHLWRVLDEIDYGLILVSADSTVRHANHLARYELARGQFLSMGKQQLQASPDKPEITAELLRGIHGASRGRRHMLTLRHGDESLPVACVPLFQPFEGECSAVLVMLGRQSTTPNLALTFFARQHALTATEEGVLRALCKGQDITDIASAHRVAESTIRTQIRSLRDKTQCHSIRVLVQQVAALPPVVPVSLTVQTLIDRTTRHWQTSA